MSGRRAFMLAETIAASVLWLVSLFAVFSTFAYAVRFYAAAGRRLEAEERAASALACLAARGSPGGYAGVSGGCTVCGVAVSRYTFSEGDEEYSLLWPDS